jgi:hypothetical protein
VVDRRTLVVEVLDQEEVDYLVADGGGLLVRNVQFVDRLEPLREVPNRVDDRLDVRGGREFTLKHLLVDRIEGVDEAVLDQFSDPVPFLLTE